MINGINGYARTVTFNKSTMAPPAEKASGVANHQQQISVPRQANGLKLIMGEELKRQKALWALGMARVKEWENRGLEISQKTMDAACRVFDMAFSEGYKKVRVRMKGGVYHSIIIKS